MALQNTDIDTLMAYILATIGPSAAIWPGGWNDQIEAALIDAVFSVRARYGSRTPGHETGVYGAVTRWIAHRGGTADDLTVLAATDADALRGVTNSGRIVGRYKSEVVLDAAKALIDVGVVHSGDFGRRQPEAHAAYLSVKGCGPVTWSYFRMLLGEDDVKPDTWVMRFVRTRSPASVLRMKRSVWSSRLARGSASTRSDLITPSGNTAGRSPTRRAPTDDRHSADCRLRNERTTRLRGRDREELRSKDTLRSTSNRLLGN
jgi:hypothetical protein